MANVGNHVEVINLDSNRPFAAKGFKVCHVIQEHLAVRCVASLTDTLLIFTAVSDKLVQLWHSNG
jgi:hypothetical protein